MATWHFLLYTSHMKTFLWISLIGCFPWMGHATETYLLDVRQGSFLSDKIKDYRHQSYETAYGDTISFEPWYRTSWTDMRILWLTQYTDRFGIIWGVSTGERGAKYTIEPGFTLGWLYQYPLSKQSTLTVRAQGVLGGRLKEKTCIADYGGIGGVQEVNCRLAATSLAPEDTLKYLLHEHPKTDNTIQLSFIHRF